MECLTNFVNINIGEYARENSAVRRIVGKLTLLKIKTVIPSK